MLNLIAVLLRRELGHQPFPSINPEPGAPDDLLIRPHVPVVIGVRVAAAIVGNLDYFLGPVIGLRLTRTRVLVAEFLASSQPPEYSGLIRHIVGIAD
jgi:hypothetical protein